MLGVLASNKKDENKDMYSRYSHPSRRRAHVCRHHWWSRYDLITPPRGNCRHNPDHNTFILLHHINKYRFSIHYYYTKVIPCLLITSKFNHTEKNIVRCHRIWGILNSAMLPCLNAVHVCTNIENNPKVCFFKRSL